MDRLEDLLRQRQESLRPSRPLPIRAVPCHPLSHLDHIFPMPTPPDRTEGAGPPSASSSPSSPLTRTEQHRKLVQISLGYLDILPWTTPSSSRRSVRSDGTSVSTSLTAVSSESAVMRKIRMLEAQLETAREGSWNRTVASNAFHPAFFQVRDDGEGPE